MKRYLKRRWILFAVTIAVTILADLVMTGKTVLEQKLIDSAMAVDIVGMGKYILLVLGSAVLAGAVYVAANVCQELFSAKLTDDMRRAVFSGVLRRNRADFTGVNSSDYVSALTNDLKTIQSGYLGMLFMVVIFGAAMAFSAALMFFYQPVLASAALACAAVMTLIPSALGGWIGKWERVRSRKFSALTTCLTELFSGFQVIASFGIRGHAEEKFRTCSRELKAAEYRANGLSAFSVALAQLLSSVAQTVILALACYMVFHGKLSIGALVAFISLNQSFCSGLSMVLRGIPMLKGVRPVIDRVNGLADYRGQKTGGGLNPTLTQTLEVRDLTFRYQEETPVLENASLTLEAGEKYALTGESGSGKTTLIRLLTGELEGYQGEICYDGVELRRLDRERISGLAAVIHQDVFLFDDTIRNNICLFDEFPEDVFREAVRLSGVDKFMDQLPGGADYRVGQRGEFLSGGQRQRVVIARALIRRTPLLILDEGTSALDADTAREIEEELLNIRKLTLLTVTHHLHNPQKYRRILKLAAGACTG